MALKSAWTPLFGSRVLGSPGVGTLGRGGEGDIVWCCWEPRKHCFPFGLRRGPGRRGSFLSLFPCGGAELSPLFLYFSISYSGLVQQLSICKGALRITKKQSRTKPLEQQKTFPLGINLEMTDTFEEKDRNTVYTRVYTRRAVAGHLQKAACYGKVLRLNVNINDLLGICT